MSWSPLLSTVVVFLLIAVSLTHHCPQLSCGACLRDPTCAWCHGIADAVPPQKWGYCQDSSPTQAQACQLVGNVARIGDENELCSSPAALDYAIQCAMTTDCTKCSSSHCDWCSIPDKPDEGFCGYAFPRHCESLGGTVKAFPFYTCPVVNQTLIVDEGESVPDEDEKAVIEEEKSAPATGESTPSVTEMRELSEMDIARSASVLCSSGENTCSNCIQTKSDLCGFCVPDLPDLVYSGCIYSSVAIQEACNTLGEFVSRQQPQLCLVSDDECGLATSCSQCSAQVGCGWCGRSVVTAGRELTWGVCGSTETVTDGTEPVSPFLEECYFNDGVYEKDCKKVSSPAPPSPEPSVEPGSPGPVIVPDECREVTRCSQCFQNEKCGWCSGPGKVWGECHSITTSTQSGAEFCDRNNGFFSTLSCDSFLEKYFISASQLTKEGLFASIVHLKETQLSNLYIVDIPTPDIAISSSGDAALFVFVVVSQPNIAIGYVCPRFSSLLKSQLGLLDSSEQVQCTISPVLNTHHPNYLLELVVREPTADEVRSQQSAGERPHEFAFALVSSLLLVLISVVFL
eukprot:TRINITY_DN2803_c0_g1_i1.p1 TRINITY_DN2803_c0_g1~~TRINITY_DN2803_c0_g1_i1.p1  ORF type:complete len:602 (+),score=105.57 TRINITY_DN2803_c0_g1_i1:95-1807(+)